MNDMEKARQILRRVWIGEAWATANESRFTDERAMKNELAIDTCMRVAKVNCNWRAYEMPARAKAIKKALEKAERATL